VRCHSKGRGDMTSRIFCLFHASPYQRFSCAAPFVLLFLSLHIASESVAGEAEPARMEAIKSLRLDLIPGDMPTFYSPGAQLRAKYLQTLLGGEIDYYAREFHVHFARVIMAVLNTNQWPKVVGDDPYGMPSVSEHAPYVFVMPAGWNEVTWMPFPEREEVAPAILRRALANGKTWDQIKFEGCDGIGTHEIGHSVIDQLGIDAQTHWLNEFLASYVGYAYLKTRDPQQALSNEIFWTHGLKAPHPFTKLDDFESKYVELEQKYPANYGWYQVALDQRVIEIYRQSGVGYLRTIREQFPKGAPQLDSKGVLNKLERISPGWKAWSKRLEAGDVTAVTVGAVH
jgi:hypothetical protein